MTGCLAFNAPTITGILFRTMKGDYNYCEQRKLSVECKNLIGGLLKTNPEERMSLEDALKHPWFNILKRRLKLDNIAIRKLSYES